MLSKRVRFWLEPKVWICTFQQRWFTIHVVDQSSEWLTAMNRKDGTLNILKLTSLHSKCVKLLWAIGTNSWNMMKYVEMMFTQNVCLFSRAFGRDFIWFYRGVAHSRSDSGTRQYNMLHERNQLWQVFSEPAVPRTRKRQQQIGIACWHPKICRQWASWGWQCRWMRWHSKNSYSHPKSRMYATDAFSFWDGICSTPNVWFQEADCMPVM